MAKEVRAYDSYHAEQRLGECVVHADPSNSRSLLDTRIGGKEEQAAALELVPALSRCVASGAQIALTPEIIREAVGLAYYRMEMAVRGITSRPKAGTE